MDCVDQTEVAELFNLTIRPSDVGPFLEKANKVSSFFSVMEGFSRLEIMLIDHTNLLVLLRWNNGQSFEKNLTHILNSCIMKDWFQLATSVRYQPVFIQSPKEHSAKEPIAT